MFEKVAIMASLSGRNLTLTPGPEVVIVPPDLVAPVAGTARGKRRLADASVGKRVNAISARRKAKMIFTVILI